MSANRKATIDFINAYLESRDNIKVAKKLGVLPNTVSQVRNGHKTSKPILDALEDLAIQHMRHTFEMMEYKRKSETITL